MTEADIQLLIQENLRLNSALNLQCQQLSQLDAQLRHNEEQLKLKDEQLKLKDEQLERKTDQILWLQRQLYGRRSEKHLPNSTPGQLSLFDSNHGEPTLEAEKHLLSLVEDIQNQAKIRRTNRKEKSVKSKRTYRIPDNIERREIIIEPEGDLTNCVMIGQDITERLMMDSPKFWAEKIIRPIYKLIEQDKTSVSTTILQAKPQATILPGSMAGESLLSRIIIDKFLYHIPEYRQAKYFKSLGIDISTSTINRWVHAIAEELHPLYIAQMQQVLSCDYIQVDETTLSITDRPGKSRKGYIWAIRSVKTPGLFFHYDKGSRSQEVILKLLKDYQGALQTDGYAAYSIYEDKQGVLPLGCMAHVRRKFETALKSFPEAQKGLDYIALLYMLEANLEDDGADHRLIAQQRMEKAYPILQHMENWMTQTYDKITPKSLLAKAIEYAFGMWPRICRYCSDGHFQIDNNGIENAIRPIALGRKNYLFAGNDNGAEDNCIFYSLLGSCLQAKIEPELWFIDVLQKIPTLNNPVDWNALLPRNYILVKK